MVPKTFEQVQLQNFAPDGVVEEGNNRRKDKKEYDINKETQQKVKLKENKTLLIGKTMHNE